jgi:hypothetical protein
VRMWTGKTTEIGIPDEIEWDETVSNFVLSGEASLEFRFPGRQKYDEKACVAEYILESKNG